MADKFDKKKLLDVRLTNNEEDTLETIRVVEQARADLREYEPEQGLDDGSVQAVSLGDTTYTWKKQEQPIVGEHTNCDNVLYDTASTGKPRFIDRVVAALSGVIPQKGDPPLEIIRKCIFFIALITLIVSLSYIVNDMIVIPVKNKDMYQKITELYNPDNPVPPPADFPEANYPSGILDSFKALYARNQDTRGWFKYTDANGKWLDINYPVMYSGDNEYYLDHDFQKAKNKNGALFFDMRNNLESPDAFNRVLIIYGHNMASGQMLSPLNKFLNNLNYMRSAPLMTMDTLYRRGEYAVFSVMLLSTRKEDGPYFDYLRTSFSSDEDFEDFIANIRARSIYDFNNIDVNAQDELLILSTCTAESKAKFKDGRCVVVARRVRNNETIAVRSADIVKNKDVIMPYAWYVNQKLAPHKYYTETGYTVPGAKSTVSTVSRDITTPTTYSGHITIERPTGTITGTGSTDSTQSGSGSATASGTTTQGSNDSTSETSTSGSDTSVTSTGDDTTTTGDTSKTTGEPTTTDDDTPSTDKTEPDTTEPETDLTEK
ncbi:MAG: class B sortase [Oscillospiraceae bacterium]|nr:class B sortase [Oscillospiraceae bacterium]